MILLPNFESGKIHLSNNFSLRNHNPVSFKSCFLSAELHLQLGNITAQPRVFKSFHAVASKSFPPHILLNPLSPYWESNTDIL